MREHFVTVPLLLVAVLIYGAVSTGTLDQLSVRAETPGTVGRTRSEIDLETDKSVIICAGQNKSLECVSPGSNIAIQEAFWGRLSSEICPSEDGDPVTNCLSDPTTTPIVRKLCDNKEYCEIPARHSVLQPPGVKHCPGVNKYLAVKYTCIPEKRKFVLCNGETTELACGQGWKIHVMSAYWGRDSPSTCPTPLGKFFTCANSENSVSALRSRCSGRETCVVTADNQHLTKDGDHCPGIDKYAVISYRCQPHEDEADGHANNEQKLLEPTQQDTAHSSVDLTLSSKSPAPQSTMDGLNLSMLLPIPQSQASDKLKPIIEFLGGEGQETTVKNLTSLGENLPIPKDDRPTVLHKSSAAESQAGIASSTMLSSASTSNAAGVIHTPMHNSLPIKNQQTPILPSSQDYTVSTLGFARQNNDITQAVNHSVPTKPSNLPSPSNIEELVKTFLASNFGRALGKSLLNLGTLEDLSYKNVMAKHFGSTIKSTTAPFTQFPLNKDSIGNLVSGLMPQSSKQSTSENSGGTNYNNLSSPIISIGNKVFSLDALSSVLNNTGNDEKHAVQDKSKDANSIMEVLKGSRKHSVKEANKGKIRRLNEKIATLETLSDALDALTAKLSSAEKSKSDKKYLPISLSPEQPKIQGKKYHTHYHHHHEKKEKNQFDEDMEMLGTLLARHDDDTHSRTEQGYSPHDNKFSNYIAGRNGQKSLTSAELDILQSKINKAIEMAESVEQKSAKQTNSTWLPALVAGKLIQEEGAHTREEVATVHTNHSNPQGSLHRKDSEFQSLQEILTRLIDKALRKGTLNELVKKWSITGSPFAEIAKNISSFLQRDGGIKVQLDKNVSKTTFRRPPAKPPLTAVKYSLKSQLLGGILGLNNKSRANGNLFTKAVNNILGILEKRQNFHKNNSTNQSLYATTDTLTNFKGILLGGRISKMIPQEGYFVRLGSKIMAEILRAHGNKGTTMNSSKQENHKLENKTRDKSNMKIDLVHGLDNKTILKPFQGDHGKEKLTFSNYDTKNMSRSVRNSTLMDFMNSMSGNGSLNPLPNNTKSGDKYSQVKPHTNDLLSMIVAGLLHMKDTDQDSSTNINKTKVQYDESGNERLLPVLPNDHKLSDYSADDEVLEVPNDHAAKLNSSAKLTNNLFNSTLSFHTLAQNKAHDLKTKAPKDKENLDLGDQTVTLTLEAIDDTSVPSTKAKEEPKEQTGLRSNKVPHYFNINSATTVGKINSTSSKNMEHSFPQHQTQEVQGVFSDVTMETKKPDDHAQSDSDGKLLTITPSSGIRGDSQIKEIQDLPLGLQMNAIGRIADTDDDRPLSSTDLSATLTPNTGLSDSLRSKSAEAKTFEDKLLPMASDLTSLSDIHTTTVENPIKKTPEKELPTASEVREVATSIKALLKILSAYSKKLKLDGEEDDSRTGLLPARSRTAEKITISHKHAEEQGTKMSFDSGTKLMADTFGNKLLNDESLNTLLESPKYKNNNPYVNFPQSSPMETSYVDSGGFQNIQEQPRTDLNSYNWNFGPLQAHAQIPLDSNPTKSSLQPRLGVDQWSPGGEVSRVTEELKDLNLPSIEDDPTVRAVQHIVAEENMFSSQKRKAIQKHEQEVSVSNAHLPRKLGIFGRNTIPKHKVKGYQRNESHVGHKKKATISAKSTIKIKPKGRGRGRDRNEIPRVVNNTISFPEKELVVNNSKTAIKLNVTQHNTNQNQSDSHKKTGNSGKKEELVSSRDNLPNSGYHSTLNDSAAPMHNKTIRKFKTSLTKSFQLGQLHATSKGVVKAIKKKNQGKSKQGQT